MARIEPLKTIPNRALKFNVPPRFNCIPDKPCTSMYANFNHKRKQMKPDKELIAASTGLLVLKVLSHGRSTLSCRCTFSQYSCILWGY